MLEVLVSAVLVSSEDHCSCMDLSQHVILCTVGTRQSAAARSRMQFPIEGVAHRWRSESGALDSGQHLASISSHFLFEVSVCHVDSCQLCWSGAVSCQTVLGATSSLVSVHEAVWIHSIRCKAVT